VIGRREFILLLGSVAAAGPRSAYGQARTMPVIGFLHPSWPNTTAPLVGAFHQGLKGAGYVEGQNVAVEYRWAEGRYDRLPELVTDLVNRKVALIAATGGTKSAQAAKDATTTIPILFSAGFDPVRTGLVANFNRPGGNVTGVSLTTFRLHSKRLELLRELVSISGSDTIAALLNPTAGGAHIEAEELGDVMRDAGQQLLILKASADNELEAAFAQASKEAKAIIVSADSFFGSRRPLIVSLAARYRLPAMYPLREYVATGGLISYGPSITDAYRQVGDYAGRILKGAKPAELPVQAPTLFRLIINLKTLKDLGLEVPRIVAARADEIIE
jgi:putative ABC transport system substrate-binding protein